MDAGAAFAKLVPAQWRSGKDSLVGGARRGLLVREASMRAGLFLVATVAGQLALAQAAVAGEGGSSFYMLGTRATNAGVVPPPGGYLQFGLYGYSGNASASIPLGGRLEFDLQADAVVGLLSGIYVADGGTVFGGRPYVVAMLPVGWKEIGVAAELTGPGGGVISGRREDSDLLIGDPVLGVGLGWGEGPWLGSLNLVVNVPVGDYSLSRPTNIALNRWAADLTGGLTWIGPDGWQVNGALGITLNGENEATDYRSGTEMHLEAAVAKTTGSWTFGLAGYHMQQISGDSGAGAVLGDFKGRVSAIGPTVSWSGLWGRQPVSIDARWLREFDAENRMEGDVLFLNLTVPLGVKGG